MSPKTILVMAGGTGGHVFPGLAVADELRALLHVPDRVDGATENPSALADRKSTRLNSSH